MTNRTHSPLRPEVEAFLKQTGIPAHALHAPLRPEVKAGKASGLARRNRALLRERLFSILQDPVGVGDYAGALAFALVEKAVSGDVGAIDWVLRLLYGSRDPD